MSNARRPLFATLLGALGAGSVLAQSTTRVSVDSSGAQGFHTSRLPSVSADGRYVAFLSLASNLVPGDTNANEDVFVRDRQSGLTELASIDSGGTQGNSSSSNPSISADGRFVAFASFATNLVPGDTNATQDVFVRDRQTGVTVRVSVDSAGAQASWSSSDPSLSADGRFVAFTSAASNLVPADTNGAQDVFVHDRQTGATERVSVSTGGLQGIGDSSSAAISADGRYVAFESYAANLVPGDTNGTIDVLVRDRQSGTTERVSLDSGAGQADRDCAYPAISADGRFVAFASRATNLVPGDTNGWSDVFVRDRQSGATERVSVDSSGAQGNFESYQPSLSADGRFVAFWGDATNLVPADTNERADVFVRDRLGGTTERASVDSSAVQGNRDSGEYGPSISADGSCVAFGSRANNLVSGDTNAFADIFVRDRGAQAPGTDLCQPGAAGVIGCPCANPPASAPRGCDNSSTTGGAQLASSGTSSVAADTLVFVTSGERPSATSILLQGDLELPAGATFGQGVRCAAGTLRRLYVKTAVGGSITAPGAGDPSVSARSAALGDVLGPVSVRWYAVYYRDPGVLGGCPATSTFNSTQTQRATWTP